jgi:glycosyltransferase involved in cell wall biosynthesis
MKPEEARRLARLEFGGLDQVKRLLDAVVEHSHLHAEIYEQVGLAPPRGILLAGPAGTGKTWLAYAIAGVVAHGRNFIGRTEWDRAVLFAINPTARYFSCNEALSDRFYTCAWNPELSKKGVIYSTSSGNYYKGSLLLARAIVLLKARGWKNIQLRLAGMNPSYDAGKVLVKFIRTHHLEENIVLLERLSPEQITAEMLSAAVYVHPSHIDNSPNSLCEAMLVGLPCIAAHAGGIPSLVRDGEDGLLYHDRDAYMLADRIALLLADRPLATRLGAHARQTALARHDREQIARRMVEIYQQVISGRPN